MVRSWLVGEVDYGMSSGVVVFGSAANDELYIAVSLSCRFMNLPHTHTRHFMNLRPNRVRVKQTWCHTLHGPESWNVYFHGICHFFKIKIASRSCRNIQAVNIHANPQTHQNMSNLLNIHPNMLNSQPPKIEVTHDFNIRKRVGGLLDCEAWTQGIEVVSAVELTIITFHLDGGGPISSRK